jgi:hypothetical protein
MNPIKQNSASGAIPVRCFFMEFIEISG